MRQATLALQILEGVYAAMPSRPEVQGNDLYLAAHEVFTILDHVWKLTEGALKKHLTVQERTRIKQVKQLVWLLLEDRENDFKQDRSVPLPAEPTWRGNENIV